jgi:very-short-patch-repair endonuclease
MRASDIIPNVKEGKRGAGDLKAYLEFAESGKIPDFGKRTGKGPDSPFEVSVANIVASLGYETHYQVGVDGFLVDIGVCDPKNPDFYLCGIECDGAPYHSHPVARDRDRLREEILRSRGWKIHRIWSTDWYRNRKTEIERLTKALQQLVA